MQCLLDLLDGTVCQGGGVDGDGDVADVADLLHPHRWGDQNVVVLPVQHLLVHALQTHCFRDLGRVEVVPAVGVPGQGGCFGVAAEGGEGGGWRWSCMGSDC